MVSAKVVTFPSTAKLFCTFLFKSMFFILIQFVEQALAGIFKEFEGELEVAGGASSYRLQR